MKRVRRQVVTGGMLAALLINGCQPSVQNSVSETDSASHVRMRDALATIASNADRDNVFVGEQTVRDLRGMLSLPSYTDRLDPDPRWKFFLDLGVRELRLGHEQQAIEHLTTALSIVPDTSSPEKVEALSHYHLAVAWLRHAETQNCCQRDTADSCIVPVQGDGIHQKKEAAQAAVKHLLQVLQSSSTTTADNERLETRDSARWLFNIAAMVLGDYPNGVPEEFRVPPEFFQSDVAFPAFRNVLPSLNLDTFNLCGGVVVDDLDGDLDLDIVTCTWDVTGQTKVFRNNSDGTFDDVTEQAGLSGFYGGLNMNQADYDNDGDLDLFIMRGAWLQQAGRHPNSLLRNDGGLKFTDVTFDVGLAEPWAPTKTAAWADYDNDGDLDLYVGHESSVDGIYAAANGDDPVNAPCQLFRNDGKDGFTDVAQSAGVADVQFSMGAVWGDYNNDRYPDLFLSLVGENRLYRNNKDGTFTDVARQAGVLDPPSSFASWFFDFDNDGHLDLFVGCNSGPVGVLDSSIRFHLMKLYRNDGNGSFQDVAADRNLTYPAEPMGANFGDLDNDGYPDFYLATGNVAFSEIRPNVMFRNNQGNDFSNVTMAGRFGHLQKGHAVSFADIDNDGDQDVYVQLGGAYAADRNSDALFRNPGFSNHYIKLALQGVTSNRCGIGVRIAVTVADDDSERVIHQHVSTGSSFGANPLFQTIGVGAAGRIRKLSVYWPTSDQRQEFSDVGVDTAYRVVESEPELKPLQVKSFSLPD